MTNNYKDKIKEYLTNDDTFATTLLAIVLDRYGVEGVLNAEKEALLLQIQQDYGVKLPKQIGDRLNAAVIATSTNLPFTDLGTFIVTADSFSRDREANFQVTSPLPVEDASWAVTELMINDPAPSMDELRGRFSYDVLRYLAAVMVNESIITPPSVLAFVPMPDSKAFSELKTEDDPELQATALLRSQEKTQEVNQNLAKNLVELGAQMQNLPLKHKSSDFDSDTWLKSIVS